MRTIRQLLLQHERVWFYLRDEETEILFAQELNEMDAKYLNGNRIFPSNCSPIMSVHRDGRVAHLMIMIWNASFSPAFKNHSAKEISNVLKVDYQKYRNGCDDYICKKSEFIRIG